MTDMMKTFFSLNSGSFDNLPTGIKIINTKLLDLDHQKLNILYDYEPTNNSGQSIVP